MGTSTDIHGHYCPASFPDLIAASSIPIEPMEKGFYRVGGRPFAPFPPGMLDLTARSAQMDKAGVAREVISVPPGLFLYYLEPAAGAKLCRRLNEALATAAKAQPERFIAFATVPLQNPELAAVELEYAIRELGMAGVGIGASVEDRDLDDPSFRQFFAAVERLDVPIFVHPHARLGGERVGRFALLQLAGWPFDTSLALAHFIFGGVLDAFPRLRLCFAHGGGTLPFLKGRMDHGARSNPAIMPSGGPPSSYLRRVFFDSIVYHDDVLSFLVGAVGADRLILGTDWPYPLGEPDPVGFVRRNEQLKPGDVDAILFGNFEVFLGEL